MIQDLLRTTHERGASDLHLTVGSAPVLRLHGDLRAMPGEPLKPQDTMDMARELLTRVQFETLMERGEYDFSWEIEGVSRYRINAYCQRGSLSMAVRVVPRRIPSPEELGIPDILIEMTHKPQGLFLVTGPTGSGKSTTLACMLDYINKRMRRHIITLEDPIEYLHHHQQSIVDQREVGKDTQTFASGLRAALRQDPDVILVGEMRDLETISTAITAAETGHLVFATLHTADAPQTIDRIVDVFPPEQQQQIRVQLAAVLLGVVSQRLLPRTNMNGRVAAQEILVNTPAVANLIRSEKVHQIRTSMQTGKAQGMQTLEMHLQDLIRRGDITDAVAREQLSHQNTVI
ncbi:type IV pilus twitching motility protein PilT [Tumebacillus sp. ITR2]|uniref:Type IV pilus twitching motility protein PilT n=1 Tax=Tumebacillus amylolyticus TaxID=2801339 RepID=A0ABS1JA00_9BACL|nr:type IV pilus twitching motility protein PilT [Tumebacillus amylolyticus]MBL0387071.1 type IV pilus twitching motility protein PilT [Tumebacillus amylolyticus]